MKANYLSPRTSLIKWKSALLAFSFLIGPLKARQDLSRSMKVWLDDIGLLAEAVSAPLEIKSALSNGVSDAPS
jgi:hypothetical protein